MNMRDSGTRQYAESIRLPPQQPRRVALILTRCVLVFVCGLFPLLAPSMANAEGEAMDSGYTLGSGYQIPGSNWHLGGYATASLEVPEGESARVAVDNLSLFLWWQGEGRWKFFSELEYENPISSRSDRLSSDDYLSWERAYLEYAWSDDISVRAGKFLTPIGRWNLIHATPLVWTTSRPLVTTLPFPTNMTGVMVTATLPSLARGAELSLYGSTGSEIRPNPEIDPFSSAFGGHVTIPLSGESQVGFSYVDFEQEKTRPERKQLIGIDALWTHDRFELSGEAVYRSSDQGGAADEKGAFVQLVAPMTERLYFVGRFESYKFSQDSHSTEMWVGGLNFRIRPSLVLKAEWVGARHNTIQAPDGFLTSISVLL